MALNLKHQTAAEFISKLRERWRNAEREEAARIANWLYNRWQAGDVTWPQIQNAFNLDTQEKRDAFQAKLLQYRDAYQAIKNAAGGE